MAVEPWQVITEEQAVPFTLVTGREESTEDYEGIVMDLLKVCPVVPLMSYPVIVPIVFVP